VIRSSHRQPRAGLATRGRKVPVHSAIVIPEPERRQGGEKCLPIQPIQPCPLSHVELITREKSAPTVKQHLAAIRMLFDWLVTGQIVPFNPASSVRGPKFSVKRGKTHVLAADEARQLLNSIDTATLIGLRDRALIGVMVYSFARVTAALGMRVEDYFVEGRVAWFRLH
jgi:site-specific recombinase XerD